MPSKFRVRRVFRGLVYAIARPLARAGATPNSITYLSLLFALVAFISLPLTQLQLLFAILVFIAGLLDVTAPPLWMVVYWAMNFNH